MELFKNSISQLENLKNAWASALPSIPATINHNGVIVRRDDIETLIIDVDRLLNLADIQEHPDMAMIAIHLPGINSQCQQIAQILPQFRGNPSAFLPNIINILWGFKSSLLWMLPAGEVAWESWPSRSGEIEETLRSISQVHDEATRKIHDVKLLQAEINGILEFLPRAKELSTELQKTTQEITNSKVSAESNAVSAAAKNTEVSEYVNALRSIVDEQNLLLKYFESKKSEVESTLEGASKVALAASFSKLQGTHNAGKKFWIWSFYFGIACMIVLEAGLSKLIPGIPSLSADTWVVWFLSRLTVASPIIWLTWFSAMQYSREYLIK